MVLQNVFIFCFLCFFNFFVFVFVYFAKHFKILCSLDYAILFKALVPFWKVNRLILNYRCKLDVQTTIFQCSKDYGSQTRITRLKVAPKMADLIHFNDSDVTLIH